MAATAAAARAIRICIGDSSAQGVARIANAFCKRLTASLRCRTTLSGSPRPGEPERLALQVRSADELVPESVDGEEVLRRFRVALDLLAHAGDVHVDGARQRHLLVAPHVRQQRIARERGAAMLDEVPQEL